VRTRFENDYPGVYDGLKASIAFASATVLFGFIGLGAGCAKGARVCSVLTGLLLISVLIGLIISVGVFAGKDEHKVDSNLPRFHKSMKDQYQFYQDNDKDIPKFCETWRNSYYGTIICMCLGASLGLIASIGLITKKVE
jgi:hypothetical protein